MSASEAGFIRYSAPEPHKRAFRSVVTAMLCSPLGERVRGRKEEKKEERRKKKEEERRKKKEERRKKKEERRKKKEERRKKKEERRKKKEERRKKKEERKERGDKPAFHKTDFKRVLNFSECGIYC